MAYVLRPHATVLQDETPNESEASVKSNVAVPPSVTVIVLKVGEFKVAAWQGSARVMVNATLSLESAGAKVDELPPLLAMVIVFWTLTEYVFPARLLSNA